MMQWKFKKHTSHVHKWIIWQHLLSSLCSGSVSNCQCHRTGKISDWKTYLGKLGSHFFFTGDWCLSLRNSFGKRQYLPEGSFLGNSEERACPVCQRTRTEKTRRRSWGSNQLLPFPAAEVKFSVNISLQVLLSLMIFTFCILNDPTGEKHLYSTPC